VPFWTIRSGFIGALLTFCFAVSVVPAKADVVNNVNMTFASGASFAGTVSFSDDFTQVTGVSGTLFGYSPSIFGYVGGDASDPISWVWQPG